jgi:hypothetical protein
LVKPSSIVGGLLTAACLLGLTGQSALAQDNAATQLQACAGIHSDIDRLGCYDKAFGQNAATAAAPPSQIPAHPAAAAAKPTDNSLTVPDDQTGWSNKETVSGLDNSKIETAILPAATARISRLAANAMRDRWGLLKRRSNWQASRGRSRRSGRPATGDATVRVHVTTDRDVVAAEAAVRTGE